MQKRLLISVFFAILLGFLPAVSLAHGFGQRIDLPVPLYLYLFGGGAVVAFSFILLGLLPSRLSEAFYNYPAFKISERSAQVLTRSVLELFKILLVVFLFVIVAGGFFGNQNPAFNILPTTVWILFAIGVTFVTIFFGNVWSVINPFKTLYEYGEMVARRLGVAWRQKQLPASLGLWPAIVLFFCFRWIENVSLLASDPQPLAWFIVAYALVTIACMSVFGKNEWLTRGDPFSVFFSFLSRFSLFEVRDMKGSSGLYVRPPAVGLLSGSVSTTGMLFILLMLSSVAADGVLTTPVFQNVFRTMLSFGLPWYLVGTLGLILLFVTFVVIYFGFSYITKVVSRDSSTSLEVARRYVCSLLPISIAYEIAHYVSILLIEGQRALYLISDPFSLGWNLFGTVNYQVDYTILDLKILWNVQVGLIVIGHVIAVIIAHTIARRYFTDDRRALISQYPMLALMIFYSVLSLWIMAQPIMAVE